VKRKFTVKLSGAYLDLELLNVLNLDNIIYSFTVSSFFKRWRYTYCNLILHSNV